MLHIQIHIQIATEHIAADGARAEPNAGGSGVMTSLEYSRNRVSIVAPWGGEKGELEKNHGLATALQESYDCTARSDPSARAHGYARMATVELSELVSYCLALAEGAGALIREVYHSPDAHGHGTVQTKEDDSPVTVADLRAQRFIMGSLAARYPSLLVIGEEDDAVVAQRDEVVLLDPAVDAPAVELPQESTVRLADLVLWLDPLDGTRSFVDRRPADVTTLLGIAHRGSPLVGIVAFPLDDSRKTVWGGPRIGLHNVDSGHMTPLDTALTASPLVGLSYWVAEDPDKLAAVEAALPPQLFDLDTSAGGSGRLCVDVLEGKIDAARCHGFKWDAAAPAALLAAVGGQLTDMTGKALSYHAGTEQANRGGVILSLNDHWRYLGHEASSESPRLSSASEVTGSPPVAVSPASGVRTPTSPHDDSDGTHSLHPRTRSASGNSRRNSYHSCIR